MIGRLCPESEGVWSRWVSQSHIFRLLEAWDAGEGVSRSLKGVPFDARVGPLQVADG